MTVRQKIREQLPAETAKSCRRPFLITLLAVLLGLAAPGAVGGATWLGMRTREGKPDALLAILAGILVGGLCALLAWGMWSRKNWARVAVMSLAGLGLAYFWVTIVFDLAGRVLAGESIMSLDAIAGVFTEELLRVIAGGLVPGGILYILIVYTSHFEENPGQRRFVDRGVRHSS